MRVNSRPTVFLLTSLLIFSGCNLFSSAEPSPDVGFDSSSDAVIDVEDAAPDVSDSGSDLVDVSIDVPPDMPASCGAAEVIPEEGVRYRSIGTDVATLVDTTITLQANSNIACFGSPLPGDVGQGDAIEVGGEVFYIYEKVSDDTVALHQPATTGSLQNGSIKRAFNTIESWSAERGGNLVAETRREIGVLYNDGPFTGRNIVSGAVTSQTYFRSLRSAVPHNGRVGIGVVFRPEPAFHGIQIAEDFFQLHGVEITEWSVQSTGSLDGINVLARGVVIDSVIVHDDGALAEVNPDSNGITVEVNFGSAEVTNSFVYNISRAGMTIHSVADATLTVRNSTVYRTLLNDNSPTGYACVGISGNTVTGSQVFAENVATSDCTGGDDFMAVLDGEMFGDFNASDDGSAPGLNSISADLANEIINATIGLENLHLRPNSLLIDAGDTVANDHDIDGEARPAGAGFDIGADEVVP